MDQRPKLYATIAFFAGVLVCLGFKDIYPDLERRYRRRYGARKTLTRLKSSELEHVNLEDHERQIEDRLHRKDVPEGLEACVGNTPLFKIKSLSEATGCEVLAKAEVTCCA